MIFKNLTHAEVNNNVPIVYFHFMGVTNIFGGHIKYSKAIRIKITPRSLMYKIMNKIISYSILGFMANVILFAQILSKCRKKYLKIILSPRIHSPSAIASFR